MVGSSLVVGSSLLNLVKGSSFALTGVAMVLVAIYWEALAACSVRLSRRYHISAVLSKWHISLVSRSSAIFLQTLFLFVMVVTIHFLKLVALMGCSKWMPFLRMREEILFLIVPF